MELPGSSQRARFTDVVKDDMQRVGVTECKR